MTTSDDLLRLAEESRLRLSTLAVLQEQQRLIQTRSHRCLEASRLLLAGGVVDGQAAGVQRSRPARQV